MWEALLMLRLMASNAAIASANEGSRNMPLALPADTLKGMIRLSFATWRLSLPLAALPNSVRRNNDQKK